jgi:hypothetical protein
MLFKRPQARKRATADLSSPSLRVQIYLGEAIHCNHKIDCRVAFQAPRNDTKDRKH